MVDSIFTKIIKGEIPCHKIYEDELVLAFLDIHPVSEGHLLVVTKEQIENLWDLDEETYKHTLDIAKKLSIQIRNILNPQKVGMVVWGMDVPHVHVQLIPIYRGDEIKLNHDLNSEPDHQALALIAQKLAK